MDTLSTQQIREQFLNYFKKNGHSALSSSSLIPANDPTLLFTNAGMVQFKDVFLGREHKDFNRAVTIQRCLRAGGKHNDLENVGYTARHHTYFEMLGNFSFGDYFKEDAIRYAWDFLTNVLKLPEEKLWVTVFREDDESADIWLNQIHVSPDRFSRCNEADNFWSMGETGPCGPCTEIYYDHGDQIPGGPPGSADADGDRYVEIWNLVFMQYERQADGALVPLAKPCVDTGMGLERIAAVMQQVHSNYDIDIFSQLIDEILKFAPGHDRNNVSLKVIADHIRSISFLILDGVRPSNEGRGYVLRRIIRRAIRHAYKLDIKKTFLYQLVPTFVELMKSAWPELERSSSVIQEVLKQEEEQFMITLDQGMKILEQAIKKLKTKIISGSVIFKLYDTYGFPVDLVADIAREHHLTIDEAGFEACMAEQRARSQADSQFKLDYTQLPKLNVETEFVGYDVLEQQTDIVACLNSHGDEVTLESYDDGCVILKKTPFYAEAGGQVGDQGVIVSQDACFEVYNTKKINNAHVHYGKVISGAFHKEQVVDAQVNTTARMATMRHHSATHLLHAALQSILGEHVVQKGSLVDSLRLRFDFAHFNPVTDVQLAEIEYCVNQQVCLNREVDVSHMSFDEARNSGAMALFGEKYGDTVRVLTMGDFSKELCGGTHVSRTGDIGCFKIISETGIASGVRRIEAVAGLEAITLIQNMDNQIKTLSQSLKIKPDLLIEKVHSFQEEIKTLNKKQLALEKQLASYAGDALLNKVEMIQGVSVLLLELSKYDVKELKNLFEQLKNKLPDSVIVLSSIMDEKVHSIIGVSPNLHQSINAKQLVECLAEYVDGRGGGKPDYAQVGGNKPSGLAQGYDAIRKKLLSVIK